MNGQEAMKNGMILGLRMMVKFSAGLEETVVVSKIDAEDWEGEEVSQAEHKA